MSLLTQQRKTGTSELEMAKLGMSVHSEAFDTVLSVVIERTVTPLWASADIFTWGQKWDYSCSTQGSAVVLMHPCSFYNAVSVSNIAVHLPLYPCFTYSVAIELCLYLFHFVYIGSAQQPPVLSMENTVYVESWFLCDCSAFCEQSCAVQYASKAVQVPLEVQCMSLRFLSSCSDFFLSLWLICPWLAQETWPVCT